MAAAMPLPSATRVRSRRSHSVQLVPQRLGVLLPYAQAIWGGHLAGLSCSTR